MAKSATTLATELLEGDVGGLEELRIHEFADDPAAHDDEQLERFYQDFSEDFDRAQTELSETYGAPVRTGNADDDVIPLNGVFRFAVWVIDGTELYLAAAHEDREVP